MERFNGKDMLFVKLTGHTICVGAESKRGFCRKHQLIMTLALVGFTFQFGLVNIRVLGVANGKSLSSESTFFFL